MKKIELKVWQLVLMLLVSGAVGGFTVDALSIKATSAASHAVFNHLEAVKASPELVAQFNEVNGSWPPSKSKLAIIMVDAATADLK